MRIIPATLISLFIAAVFFMIIKMWGSSQLYLEYKHPFYADVTETLIFKVLTPENIVEGLKTQENIYLNVAVTLDRKLIVIDPNYEKEKTAAENKTYKFQSRNFDEITNANPKAAVLLEKFKSQLSDKRIIFNLQDNPLSATPVFIETMTALGLESGNNFIFVSPYDPPAKDLKSQQPTYLYGATDPEILRIKALESLFLVEAATFRADVVIHPLTYYKKPFFTEALVENLNRRFKKIIIGPLEDNEMGDALALKPLGVIIH